MANCIREIAAILLLLCAFDFAIANGRWSRQLSTQGLGDWVPVQPSSSTNKRQVSARVLNQPSPFQSSFFPAESSPNDYVPQEAPRQLYLQSVPAGQQSFINQQNSLNQPFVQLTLTDPQYNPLAQAFVPQSSSLQYNVQQFPQIQQNPASINNQFYTQSKTAFSSQQQKPYKQEASRYVDGYKLENVTADYYQNSAKKKPTTVNTKAKQELAGKQQQQQITNTQKVTERSSLTLPTTSTVTTVEKEEVQLLYVPLETLQREKFKDVNQLLKHSQKHEAIRDSIGSPGQINNQLYGSTTPKYTQRQQTQLHNIHQDLIQQAFNAQHLQGAFSQNQYERQPKYQPSSTVVFPFTQSIYPTPVITTPRSKKLKAHQPPLAVYMFQTSQETAQLSDVLGLLKDAKSISVLDNIGPNSPKVFVGPTNLRTPESYTKFDLPYLSSIDGNRIQRKVENLPFFVAPLSYKAPEGFAKIPFPAPHVGSVIVNPFMGESETLRSTSLSNDFPSSFAYSTFKQNPTTESFRTTVNEFYSQKPSTFNYFPSATPNPVIPQSTLSSYHSTFSPFEQQSSFNSFRPLPPNRRPEVDSSSKPPLSSYFSPPPSKPTVSYFSFASPEYTIPVTTPKTATSLNSQFRGHYITNAAVENQFRTSTSAKESFSTEKVYTTSVPTTTTTTTSTTTTTTQKPAFQSHNPYMINQAFQANEIKSPDVNEVNGYSTESPVGVRQNADTYSGVYNNNRQISENIHYSNSDDFSPIPYYVQSTSTRPAEYESSSITYNPTSAPVNSNYDQEIKDNYSSVLNQYSSGFDQIENNEQFGQYQTENPTTNEITTPTSTTTTTTTTTTTPAPTTRATRRPIHLRGRPRYTTQRTENGEQVTRATTTRRTPTRRPNTFRSRSESTKAPTTDTPVTESSNYEISKKERSQSERIQPEISKTTRYPSYRGRQHEDEAKSTTEGSLPKTSAATRNLRLRSRGKSHFKITDNYEGAELAVKKNKKVGEGESLAYQRDVLHQNYPVTLTERMSTFEIHTTSTPMPSSQSADVSKGKIRIYETTGSSTQKPYEVKQLESISERYDNEPIFQGEQQKFLTQSDSYLAINNDNGFSTLTPEIYTNSKEVTTDRANLNLANKYEEKQEIPKIQEYFESSEKKSNFDSAKLEINHNSGETQTDSASLSSETPVARFRNKLKSRPQIKTQKDLKPDVNENINTSSELNVKIEQNTEPNLSFTRRSSINVQPVTYRPAFDRRRTTMRIEEIEAELKSNRKQLQSELRSTTFKYPVYIPESSSARPIEESSSVANNELTTKRNTFARRRPVRPTQSSTPVTSSRSRVTAEEKPASDNLQTKRVKVRGRIRTRPTTTTEKAEYQSNENQSQESQNNFSEKYQRATERTTVQKYSTRGRQPAQKYFRRPTSVTERTSQEAVEDQASYDSINRPEYIEYSPKSTKEEHYNPENGKAESHWSPKLSLNSFQPIFNPNLIADEIKSEGSEYGTKLPYSEENTEKSEIITARNSYDDILVSVTPSSNKLNEEKSSEEPKGFLSSLFEDDQNESQKSNDGVSTFESVLEEVMRNLEQQDENEYTEDYDKTVMKHERGEIGEIQPDVTNRPQEVHDDSNLMINTDLKKIYDTPKTIFSDIFNEREAEDRSFSTTVENKESSTTERQGRRRGAWRRIKVRPVNKDVLQAAESQFYGNSANDLINKPEKINLEVSTNIENTKVNKKSHIETLKKIPTTNAVEFQTTTITSSLETETATESVESPGDMDFGTGSPDLVMFNIFGEAITSQPNIANEQTETEDLSFTNEYNDFEGHEEFYPTTTEREDITTTLIPIDTTNKTDINFTQRSVVTEISKEQPIMQTTTEVPIDLSAEITEKQTEAPTTETEETTYKDTTIESQTTPALQYSIYKSVTQEKHSDKVKENKDIVKKDIVPKIESVESTTAGAQFWDPKNIISTSMSTEISHETEICYRGKCIKTKKQDYKKARSEP